MAEKAAEVRKLVAKLRSISNPNMASDLSVAESLCRAAIEGGLANVEINLQSLKDQQFVASNTKTGGRIAGLGLNPKRLMAAIRHLTYRAELLKRTRIYPMKRIGIFLAAFTQHSGLFGALEQCRAHGDSI